MLNIIKMPEKKSCSICCIAMLAGLNYDEVKTRIWGNVRPKRLSMNLVEMENALIKVGLNVKKVDKFPLDPHYNMLCQCRSKSYRWWHYIVYDCESKKFLDPLPKNWDIEDYKITKCIEILT